MITRYYIALASVALLCGIGRVCAEPLRVVSYNVENLFYPTHDSLKDDLEWTPEGERHWSYTRYYRKVENIARVLTNIGEWSGVDIVGLQEVENALCVKRLCYTLRRNEYDFVHYESPDRRGIDVALIYKKARIDTIRTRAIRVKEENERTKEEGKLVTRDILYVCAKVKANGERVEAKGERVEAKGDTIHLFVCHLPSQRGGSAETEWKREQAKRVLQSAVDSVFAEDKDARIIVMGDMNSEPKEDIVGLKNRLMENGKLKMENCKGTHKFQGRWMCLDQFYVSEALDSISEVRIYDAEWIQETDEKYLGLKPYRTYNGYQYRDGYSDHLPVVLEIEN